MTAPLGAAATQPALQPLTSLRAARDCFDTLLAAATVRHITLAHTTRRPYYLLRPRLQWLCVGRLLPPPCTGRNAHCKP